MINGAHDLTGLAAQAWLRIAKHAAGQEIRSEVELVDDIDYLIESAARGLNGERVAVDEQAILETLCLAIKRRY